MSRKREAFIDDDVKMEGKYTPKKTTQPAAEKKEEKETPSPEKGRVSTLPTINIGDTVTISGNDFTINGVTYYGKALDNDTSTPVDSTTTQTKIASFEVSLQGVFQAKRIVAFQNVIATNPLETISYMRVTYGDRKVVLSEVSVFFCGEPGRINAYQRDKDDKIIPPTIDKGTISQDSGAYNKLAYLFYGDSSDGSIKKVKAALEGLPNETKVDKVVDTSKDTAELEAEKFMRDKLREWGVSFPATLSGKALEDLYTAEHQKRVNVSGKRSIQPNPQVNLREPTISHPILPETGFRKYASKILLVTLVGAGVIMYQRSIAARGPGKNSQVGGE